MNTRDYVIRGGVEGRERLRILSRVMQPSTHALLRRAGIRAGMDCLEIGCGGGDVACDMARMVGPSSKVTATDIDEVKLEIARAEAREQELANIDFRFEDITQVEPAGEFDLIHARFVLTHLGDPESAIGRMRKALRAGGVIVIEDIDFRGHFCYPECPALWRYVDLYTETVRRRGGDANIGPRLPGMLSAAGFERVQASVTHPAATEGEVKLVTPITMENIAQAAVAEGLATMAEVEKIAASCMSMRASRERSGVCRGWWRRGGISGLTMFVRARRLLDWCERGGSNSHGLAAAGT